MGPENLNSGETAENKKTTLIKLVLETSNVAHMPIPDWRKSTTPIAQSTNTKICTPMGVSKG